MTSNLPMNLGDIPSMNIPSFTSLTKKTFFNEPGNLSGWQLLGKVGIGLVIGGIIAALLFVVLSFIGGMFASAFTQQGSVGGIQTTSNPLLPLLLLFIGFLGTFIGNISVAGVYNLFFSKKYYDGSKIFGLLLLTNGLLFFILAPVYFIFADQIQSLFFVLGFHILFSVFVSACQIEFSANPHYAGSSLMGNVIGFAAAFLLYAVLSKGTSVGGADSQVYLLMLLPSVLAYSLMPFGAGIWEKIYYKLYEMGNNAFYLPSPSEADDSTESSVREQEEINIES